MRTRSPQLYDNANKVHVALCIGTYPTRIARIISRIITHRPGSNITCRLYGRRSRSGRRYFSSIPLKDAKRAAIYVQPSGRAIAAKLGELSRRQTHATRFTAESSRSLQRPAIHNIPL
jgi:hypothetical protein